MYTPVNPSFTIIKEGFNGVKIIKVCFRDVWLGKTNLNPDPRLSPTSSVCDNSFFYMHNRTSMAWTS